MMFENMWFPMMIWIIPFIIWELVWKGLGLWHSAKKDDKGWFIAILILNTAGILPIIYIYFFKDEKVKKAKKITQKQVKKK